MSDTPWYYADHQQQRQGPVPAAQLQQLLALGQITADTLVWRQGMAQWQPLHGVTELAVPAPTPVERSQDPYAAPASAFDPTALPVQEPVAPGQQAYAAFVGANFPVYRRKWRLDLTADGAAASTNAWNWPAFLFGAFWMLYRRMYAVAAMWIGALTVLSILETLIDVSDSVSLVITLGASVAAGSVGNHLYLRHTQRMIALAEARHPGDAPAQHAALAGLGGTRWSAVLVGMAIYIVVIGALSFLLDP
ncbi:GYF domain-containing protein [Stenotrophomonas rhizophila]|uniref:GYF domain-containing protein n=1 Tax=Stenotrophomonas rhizophila TaxID=216778 RepID=UPI0028B1D8D4|nr:GYF domain-containing protein [Stenotrophomonas rhizophila]